MSFSLDPPSKVVYNLSVMSEQPLEENYDVLIKGTMQGAFLQFGDDLATGIKSLICFPTLQRSCTLDCLLAIISVYAE